MLNTWCVFILPCTFYLQTGKAKLCVAIALRRSAVDGLEAYCCIWILVVFLSPCAMFLHFLLYYFRLLYEATICTSSSPTQGWCGILNPGCLQKWDPTALNAQAKNPACNCVGLLVWILYELLQYVIFPACVSFVVSWICFLIGSKVWIIQ